MRACVWGGDITGPQPAAVADVHTEVSERAQDSNRNPFTFFSYTHHSLTAETKDRPQPLLFLT